MKRTISLLAFTLLLMCACNDMTVEFRPVVRSGDRLVVSDAPMEPAFKTNLQQVLRFYNEAFTISEDGAILVPRSKWDDRDLMWNYTTKANDPAWLAEHPVSSPSP